MHLSRHDPPPPSRRAAPPASARHTNLVGDDAATVEERVDGEHVAVVAGVRHAVLVPRQQVRDDGAVDVLAPI